MLEGLYRVDWANLTHAYGNAGNVPGMILALASPQKEDRLFGFELIRESLFVHGAIFEASAYIVGYLNQLLEHPLFEEKPDVLILLAQMVNGRGPLDTLREAGLIQVDQADPRVRVQLANERAWVRMTREAVESNQAVYFRSLAHTDPAERIAAAYLLAQLKASSRLVSRELLERLGIEIEPQVKAALLLALGELAVDDPELRVVIDRWVSPDIDPLVRLAALMSVTRLDRSRTSETIRIGLVDVISSLDATLPYHYAALPWAEGHLFADIALCLCDFGPNQAAFVLPDLIRVLDRVPPKSAVSIAYAMLLLGFGRRMDLRTKLTDLQTAVLNAIEGSSQLRQVPGTTARLLDSFDAPA